MSGDCQGGLDGHFDDFTVKKQKKSKNCFEMTK